MANAFMSKLGKFLVYVFRPNTCKLRGCGHEYPANDGLCVVCRRRVG